MSPLQQELGKRNPFDCPELEAYLNLIRTEAHLGAPFHAMSKATGLSGATYNVLRILRGAHLNGKDEGVRSTQIGCDMVVRVPDVTRLVDRLVDKGLAERTRSEKDRRVVFVKITKPGLEKLAKMDHPMLDLHKQQLGHLSKSELETLSALLVKARNPPKRSSEKATPK